MATSSSPAFDRAYARAAAISRPMNVQIELTHRCNLRCRHCYLDLNHPPEELTASEWMQIVDDLAAAGALFLTLTGGELFLRRDWFAIAEHARRLGMAVTLFTSGTRLADGDAERIARLRPLVVELSLYSSTRAIHDAVTQRPGSHRKTLRAAAMLRKLGVPVALKTPLLKVNLGEVRPLLDVARRLGTAVRFDPAIVIRRDGDRSPLQLRPTPAELALIYALPELREALGPLVPPPRGPNEAVCSIARRVALIGPTGDVYPCGMHPKPAGNLRRQRFTEIWGQSPLLQVLRETTIGSMKGTCSGCAKNAYCGRCSAMAAIEDGNFLGPSTAACDRADARERADQATRLLQMDLRSR